MGTIGFAAQTKNIKFYFLFFLLLKFSIDTNFGIIFWNQTNANNQNVVPHTSHFQANPSKVDFTDTNNIFSTIQNSDHFNIKFDQPFNFERYI